ncbi:MAG: hypothetical protein GY925_26875 [Actinomycetia bacterium]|nr:hypothetical protein [Actinomycetes bacterium]
MTQGVGDRQQFELAGEPLLHCNEDPGAIDDRSRSGPVARAESDPNVGCLLHDLWWQLVDRSGLRVCLKTGRPLEVDVGSPYGGGELEVVEDPAGMCDDNCRRCGFANCRAGQ